MIAHFPFLRWNWHFSHNYLLFDYRYVDWGVCSVADTSRFRVAAVLLLLANHVILRIINHFPLVDSLIICGCLKVQEETQIWGLFKMSIGFVLGLGNITRGCKCLMFCLQPKRQVFAAIFILQSVVPSAAWHEPYVQLQGWKYYISPDSSYVITVVNIMPCFDLWSGWNNSQF